MRKSEHTRRSSSKGPGTTGDRMCSGTRDQCERASVGVSIAIYQKSAEGRAVENAGRAPGAGVSKIVIE